MTTYEPNSEGVCPHCGKGVRFVEAYQIRVDGVRYSGNPEILIASGDDDAVYVYSSMCPLCKKPIVSIIYGSLVKQKYDSFRLVYPMHIERFVPLEVPKSISDDFKEAVAVLPISEKASAALSRRCLQNVLIDKGAKGDTLSKQIDSVLPSLPSHIAENLDAIRTVGNFAAHPMKNTNTGQIVDVETAEAEWNLNVLEELFDHYYVKPAKSALLRTALDKKLQAAGKKPMKQP